MPSKKNALTIKEARVLSFLTDGYDNAETAGFLGLSRRTVEAHRARIMTKLDIHNLPGLVKYAINTGLTSVESYRPHEKAA